MGRERRRWGGDVSKTASTTATASSVVIAFSAAGKISVSETCFDESVFPIVQDRAQCMLFIAQNALQQQLLFEGNAASEEIATQIIKRQATAVRTAPSLTKFLMSPFVQELLTKLMQ